MESKTTSVPLPTKRNGLLPWLKRLGVAGFLFFLIKGLAWLIVPAVVIRSCQGA